MLTVIGINITTDVLVIRYLLFLNLWFLGFSGLILSMSVLVIHHGIKYILQSKIKYKLMLGNILVIIMNLIYTYDFSFSGNLNELDFNFKFVHGLVLFLYFFYNVLIVILSSRSIFNLEDNSINKSVLRFLFATILFSIFERIYTINITFLHQNTIIGYVSLVFLLISGLLFYFGQPKTTIKNKISE